MWTLFTASDSHTLRYAATPIEVAVNKHVAKSIGVHFDLGIVVQERPEVNQKDCQNCQNRRKCQK